MNRLLNALRVVAREEDAAAGACPAEQIPVVSESVRADIAAAVVRQLSQARVGVSTATAEPVAPAAGDQLGARRDLEARRQSNRRRMGWSLGTATLAAAAALLLWYRQPAPEVNDGAGGLPVYAVAASGGLAEVRGGGGPSGSDEGGTTTTAPVRLSGSSELRVICRPDTAVAGPVAVRAFLVRDGAATEVTPEVQVAATGAIDLRVRGSQLRGDPTGPDSRAAKLRVVLGRPRAVGEVAVSEAVMAPAESGRSRPDGAADVRWLTVPLDLNAR